VRWNALPHLGIGVSTEYGAARSDGALDVFQLAETHPSFAQFLEVGLEVDKGLDDGAVRWARQQRRSTLHFLDVNLYDTADVDDAAWLAGVHGAVDILQPAWLCGDAGQWHVGRRDRAHMMLLPPLLVDDEATDIARGVAMLREKTGLCVLPENPPGTAFVGDLHILDFFTRVAERADTGLLLDVAHLVMFQHARGLDALFGLDAFAMERVVEVHVAGGTRRSVNGITVIDDSHTTDVLDDTWRVFEAVVARATNLKAVVFECERNANGTVVDGFSRIARTWQP
jgi:uncharacterized protein